MVHLILIGINFHVGYVFDNIPTRCKSFTINLERVKKNKSDDNIYTYSMAKNIYQPSPKMWDL